MILLEIDNSPWFGFLLIIACLIFFIFKPIIFGQIGSGGKNRPVSIKPKSKHDQDKEAKEIYAYLDQLSNSFDIQSPINDCNLRAHFNAHKYAECIMDIMKKMGLNNKVKVKCRPDYKYPGKDSNAFVTIPGNIPLLNTIAFSKCEIEITMRKSVTGRYETFVYVIAHELSHIVLHGMKHPLRESEIATDLFVMVRGFNEIMKKGIQENHINGIYAEDGFTKINPSHSSINGYLGVTNFSIADEYLKKLFEKQKLKRTVPSATVPPVTNGKGVTLIPNKKTGKLYQATTNGQWFRAQLSTEGLLEKDGIPTLRKMVGFAYFSTEEQVKEFVDAATAKGLLLPGKIVYIDQLTPIPEEAAEYGKQYPYPFSFDGKDLDLKQRLAVQIACVNAGLPLMKSGKPIYRKRIYTTDLAMQNITISPDNMEDVNRFISSFLAT